MTMVLFDNHNHSEFSFDGKRSSVEGCAAAARSLNFGGIAFTDHCDHFVPKMKANMENLIPEVFDVQAQQKEIERVQQIYPDLKLLKGIEVGMHEDCHEPIRKILNDYSFDQIIASVHYLDGIDPFYGGYYEGKEWRYAYGHYLETIHKEMTWLMDFDILGHFDYIVRYAPYAQTSMKYQDFSDILDSIFKVLIHEGKALEINTKSYMDYKGRMVTADPEVLKRYRELGGEIISLGSDSHSPDRLGDNFLTHVHMLKSLGFRWTAHYEGRRLVQLPL